MSRTHCGTKGKGLWPLRTPRSRLQTGARSLCADTLQLGFAAAHLVGSAGGGGRLEIDPMLTSEADNRNLPLQCSNIPICFLSLLLPLPSHGGPSWKTRVMHPGAVGFLPPAPPSH